jgi:hypothetical protein
VYHPDPKFEIGTELDSFTELDVQLGAKGAYVEREEKTEGTP